MIQLRILGVSSGMLWMLILSKGTLFPLCMMIGGGCYLWLLMGCADRMNERRISRDSKALILFLVFGFIYSVVIILLTEYEHMKEDKAFRQILPAAVSIFVFFIGALAMQYYLMISKSLDFTRTFRSSKCGEQNFGDISYLNFDLSCTVCQYNLRGTRLNGDCGECGVLVSKTIEQNSFMFSDERWRKGLAKGVIILGCLPLISFVYTAVIMLISGEPFDREDPFYSVGNYETYITLILLKPLLVCLLAGYCVHLLFADEKRTEKVESKQKWSLYTLLVLYFGFCFLPQIYGLELFREMLSTLWQLFVPFAFNTVISLLILSRFRLILLRLNKPRMRRLVTVYFWFEVIKLVIACGGIIYHYYHYSLFEGDENSLSSFYMLGYKIYFVMNSYHDPAMLCLCVVLGAWIYESIDLGKHRRGLLPSRYIGEEKQI